MTESLVLFESIVNSRWFLRTSVILFMNKIDVFRNKIPKVMLVVLASERQADRNLPRCRWSATVPNTSAERTSTKLQSLSC